MTDEYPSARAALFDSDKLVNFRCFLKYLFWHGAYFLLAVFGLLFIGAAALLDVLFRSGGNRAVNFVRRGLAHRYVKKTVRVLLAVVILGYLVFGIAWILWTLVPLIIANPLMSVLVGLAIIGAVAVLSGVMLASGLAAAKAGGAVKSGASKAGSVAQKTPGVRRVYGRCVVSMNQEPKWFQRIFGDY